MTSPTPNPFNTKPPFSFPSKSTTSTSTSTPLPLPLSQGLLLSSSSDPLAPLELRLVSLLSYPCTAIVNPISQSPSAYPLMRAKGAMTGFTSSGTASSGLVDSPSRMDMSISVGTETPQISLPGLIDKSAGEELPKWREKNWKEGLNAGACGVSGSFRLGDGGGSEKERNGKVEGREEHERPKYIIHTHAPNFADKAYSTPLVKQLLVNCYRGALVEAMGIAEREEEGERQEREETERQTDEEEKEEEGIASNTTIKGIVGNAVFSTTTGEDMIMAETEPNTDEDMSAERESTPDMSRKRGLGSFGTVNMAGSMSGPASLASPSDMSLDAFGVSPIPSPSLLPSTSIPSITSIPPILLPSSISSTSVPLISHSLSKHHIPQSSPKPTGITVAFPAISTGHKSFPHRLAARIAVGTVRDFLRHPVFGAIRRKRIRKVVFCVWPVDSPNRKALQVAFGLNFPPPLPQSAPLSPVSNQLSTPPFSPSVKGRRGFDFKLGLALRDLEGQEGGVPRIVVTPPVTPMVGLGMSLSLGAGEKERERDASGLGSEEVERLSGEDGDLGDEGSESGEDVGMDVYVENKKEEMEKKDLEVETDTEMEGSHDISISENLTAGVEREVEEAGLREELRLLEAKLEEELREEVRLLKAEVEKGRLKEKLRLLKIEVEKLELKEQVRVLKAEIKRDFGRKDNRGRGKRGRKETYRQRKRQLGLRLAAAMSVRREREKRKGYLSSGERLMVGERDTRTPERMPGSQERKMERSGAGRIGEEDVDRMKMTDNDARRPERMPSIEERQAKRSRSKDHESRENKTVGGYIRRHGGKETRNKRERRYPERVGVGDIKGGAKRGMPSIRPGDDDDEIYGGRKEGKRRR
ncbi:uncharacterized protein EAF01_010582 [Botrytis porri]|uniref:uncharacterized protein n=1 Tax=Botrytis porri TaxID=87229 RepID=UPI00190193C5|nr:uncharacterized protein EAF01_010582 [Botrytis porri]KAF7890773.1 hypothetical protein EAF01_010582 [Botrytis porri]